MRMRERIVHRSSPCEGTIIEWLEGVHRLSFKFPNSLFLHRVVLACALLAKARRGKVHWFSGLCGLVEYLSNSPKLLLFASNYVSMRIILFLKLVSVDTLIPNIDQHQLSL